MLNATPYRPNIIEVQTQTHEIIDESTLAHKYPTTATLIRESDGRAFPDWPIASPYMALDYASDGYKVVFDDGVPSL